VRYSASAECKYPAPFQHNKLASMSVMAVIAAFAWLPTHALTTLLVILLRIITYSPSTEQEVL
jgi:hypothetical protein